ncbi:hypothetical protein EVG20_g8502 [Dentipellis fragilis]|uniref:Uncharacterized protein n=1 Tax=Dentipellis fragilis TaxID=205917 RepID=A0A4Y9Y4Y5_9AGAM|nr:hypothetical protein EVG20_g8502 [Dentipellis fragilis]
MEEEVMNLNISLCFMSPTEIPWLRKVSASSITYLSRLVSGTQDGRTVTKYGDAWILVRAACTHVKACPLESHGGRHEFERPAPLLAIADSLPPPAVSPVVVGMTLAVLRALHAIIGDALEDIDAVYSTAASSRSSSCTLPKEPDVDILPPSPASSTQPKSSARRAGTPPLLSNHSPTPAATLSVSAPSKRIIDFPSLDDPVDPADDADAEAERLRSNPAVANAISRIVAACGQLSITVRSPFLVLCDAGMGYHLPSALRFFEAAHIPELLRPAGPEGLHVSVISAALGVDAEVEGRIAHILRLLATHHLLIERKPNVFALNRISAMLDTGKAYADVARAPEKKYESTDGVAAFSALK